ncbi:MAG TPA: TMEM175 family protein, partial [Pyrinomonadaceae bacterium]|nr:TMEM175 family protein [Pyrinomonadaceae bacterium]
MNTTRLEAFSDAVIAIIMTIMVLELKIPHGDNFSVLLPQWPVFLTYALSFVYLGIYWNNHHHMLHATREVSGGVLWANLHLLFWLSLVPFATGWMGENHFAPIPTAVYGGVLLMCAVAYWLLQTCIVRLHGGSNELLAKAIGSDVKGKL